MIAATTVNWFTLVVYGVGIMVGFGLGVALGAEAERKRWERER